MPSWSGIVVAVMAVALVASSSSSTAARTRVSLSARGASQEPVGVLVELDRASSPAVAASLRRAGATLVEHDLQIWALLQPSARRLLPALVQGGLARRVEADRPLRAL